MNDSGLKYQTLIRFIEASTGVSGTLIAVTLTAFIFLVTRSTGMPEENRGRDKNELDFKIFGPFCILYSFLTSFVAYILFSIMSRMAPEYFRSKSLNENEFYVWLPPFYLTMTVLFFSILSLAFGLYHITRVWLTEKANSNVPDEVKEACLGAVYTFCQFSPVLVFLYFNYTVIDLWSSDLTDTHWQSRGRPFVAASVMILCSALPPVGRFLARFVERPIGLMKRYSLIIFVLALLQFVRNVLVYAGFQVDSFEISRTILGVLAASFLTGVMGHFMRSDYRKFCTRSIKGDHSKRGKNVKKRGGKTPKLRKSKRK